MRYSISFASVATVILVLPACAPTGDPAASRAGSGEFSRVTSEADFQARAVGRAFVFPNGDVGRYDADGTWTIDREDGPVASGTWDWTGDRWCREGQSRQGPVARDCQIVEVSGSGLRFTRSDGSGGTVHFVG